MIDRRTPSRTQALWLAIALATATVGCGGYERVSDTAYDFALALYATCNSQAADKLPAFEEKLGAARADGTLTPQEAQWLEAILASARAGDWQSATRESRALLAAQVSE